MPDKVLRTKKISRDEAIERSKVNIKSVGGNEAVMKAAKGPGSFDPEKRSAKFVMSTEETDRYGDVVSQAGLNVDQFMKNPQGLLWHKSASWPIGLWSDVTKVLTGRPKRTEGVLKFLAEGVEPDADRAVRHVAAGTLRAVSIGFIPNWDEVELILDDEEEWATGLFFKESELIECSICAIPANPSALLKSAGADTSLARELIEDVLDNWARDPATGLLLERKDYESAYRVVKAKAFDDLIVKNPGPKVEKEAEVEEDTETVSIGEAIATAPVVFVDEEGKEISEEEFDSAVEVEKKGAPEYATDLSAAENGDEFTRGVDENGNDYVAVIRDGAVAFKAVFDTKDCAEDAIARRQLELAGAPTNDSSEEEIEVIELKVDTSQLDAATERVSALSLMLDSVGEKFAKFFGRPAPVERIEPKLDTPPSPEAIAAALSKAKAARERVIAKGLS